MIDLNIHGANMYDTLFIQYSAGSCAVLALVLRLSAKKLPQFIISSAQEPICAMSFLKKIQELSSADISALGTDTLVTRLINDVNQVQVTIAPGYSSVDQMANLAAGFIIATLMLDAFSLVWSFYWQPYW